MSPTARADWGTLTRDTVVAEAVAMLRADGLATLSIRSVAERLDVSPMALYRHVANKSDLVDATVDVMFAESWKPTVSRRRWRVWTIEAADRLRQFLVEQPAALQVYLRQPVVSATAMLRMDTCLDVLTAATGDGARAHQAYAAIQTYTIGFAALESAREANTDVASPTGSDGALVSAERSRELAGYSSPEQFHAGLELLLHGVSAR